jgi:hypothetical protein
MWLVAKAVFSVDDVLKGKVDLDALDTSYVFVHSGGMAWKHGEKMIEAANVMLKFGWRVCGMNDFGILLERHA